MDRAAAAPPGVHADRTAGRHRDYRDPRRSAVAGLGQGQGTRPSGSSHFYNCSANNNDGNQGLYRKKSGDIRPPSKIVLANDFSFNCYFEYVRWGRKVFQSRYWHDKKRLGFGNVLFVDTHIGYHQATTDKPDFQRGDGWSFVYND